MQKTPLPFTVTPELESLNSTYPTPKQIKDAFINANESSRQGIIRLWITEGIPFAFKNNPLIYEDIRELISDKMHVHPKAVTMVGSGRIGYSLKKEVWGRVFNDKSDLDITIISNELFSKFVADFQRWVGDIASKKVTLKGQYQTQKWLESIETVNRNIPKGFIYIKNLPSHNNYPNVAKCYYTMRLLKERLSITENAPKVSDASVKIYSSWYACIRQIEINLKSALELRR